MKIEGNQDVAAPASIASNGGGLAFARRYPLAPVTLAYVLGVLAGWQFTLPLAVLVGVIGALMLATALYPAGRGWLLWLLFLILGWGNMGMHNAILSPVDLRILAQEAPELITLRARLVETPTLRSYEREMQSDWRSHALVEVTALQRRNEWQPAVGRVAVATPGVLDTNFFAGRAVELTGVLRQPRGALAPGLFDYRAFLAWQGVWFQLQCADTNDWRLTASSPQPLAPPLTDRFRDWAQRTLARGLPVEDEELRLL